MKLLAIETSTEACSVALWIDGQIRGRYEVAPRRHTELVLPWAGELLAEAGIGKRELDAIAVGRGPGAFTGVRLAIALAQGMALALDRPVVPVSTLAALALRADAGPGAGILAAIDARMGELYLGLFERDADGCLRAQGEEWLASASAVVLPQAGELVGVGSGFAADGGRLAAVIGARLAHSDAAALPHAAAIAQLAAIDFRAGRWVAPDALEPAYLRNKVALTSAEQAEARKAS